MEIQCFTCNPYQTNGYVCHDGGEAVLIDPSCSTGDECADIERYIEERGLTMRRLLLTHAHVDHVFGCARFARRFGMGFWMHRGDQALLKSAVEQARMVGVQIGPPPPPAGFLEDGEEVPFGSTSFRVIHVPGHSPGSIGFFEEASRTLVSGDVLFRGSIGRTDLWCGSLPELMASIFGSLIPLGDEVRVYPGHGPETTIGEERLSNPFLTGFPPAGP